MESNASKEFVSQATLKRLPQYLRIIKEHSDLEFISSTMIAMELDLNPILVRKDLALICNFDGKPGNGFEVKKMIEEIEDFLGFNNIHNAILVGARTIGTSTFKLSRF